METAFFEVTGALSLLITILAAIYIPLHCRNTSRRRRIPALLLFTICIFVSIWIFLLPEYYITFEAANGLKLDGVKIVRPALLALVNTIQVFINDGSLDTFSTAMENAANYIPALNVPYTLYASILIAIAPILTFGNVLSLFKEFTDGIRFCVLSRIKNIYILSGLNECSLALAKSINEEIGSKALIVFTGVNEESGLIFSAKMLNAVIFRKSISDINLMRLKKPVEIFLISEDETENVNRALMLTENLVNNCSENEEKIYKHNIKIFAFAHDRASGVTIDSADYKKLLGKWMRSIESNIEDCLQNGEVSPDYPLPNFRLRRVDVVQQFVWSAIQGMDFYSDKYREKLSIMIVGLGTFGLEFFKAVSWFCHFDDRKLEINIVDKIPDIHTVLNRHCPGLLKISDDNDANNSYLPSYSVRCISGIDVDNGSFDELLNCRSGERAELAERLRSTTHVIIALGDDRNNTETAIYLRELFDRVNPPEFDEKGPKYENTNIYSVLYSDCAQPQSRKYKNYNEIPYNINFIGGLSEKYSYKTVCAADLEMEAFREHVGWYEQEKPKNAEDIFDYERFEYHRNSSISRTIYKTAISKYLKNMPNEKSKQAEHNRWILYMLSNNYISGENRNDRAKIHILIKPFGGLSDEDKGKDNYVNEIKEEN